MVSCETQVALYFTFSLARVINCWWPKCAGNVTCTGCHAGGLERDRTKLLPISLIRWSPSHRWMESQWHSAYLPLVMGFTLLTEAGVCVCTEGCSCASLKSCFALSIVLLCLTWVKKRARWCLWYFCDKCYIFLSITYFCWDDWSTALDNDELFTADRQPFTLWYHLP